MTDTNNSAATTTKFSAAQHLAKMEGCLWLLPFTAGVDSDPNRLTVANGITRLLRDAVNLLWNAYAYNYDDMNSVVDRFIPNEAAMSPDAHKANRYISMANAALNWLKCESVPLVDRNVLASEEALRSFTKKLFDAASSAYDKSIPPMAISVSGIAHDTAPASDAGPVRYASATGDPRMPG